MNRSRTWMGTCWNLEEIETLRDHTQWLLIGGHEKTEEEQDHWHVIAYFKNPKQNLRTGNTHWEVVKNLESAFNYCTKEGITEEVGIRPRIGNMKKDQMLKDSLSLSKEEMADKYGMSYLRSERCCDRYKQIKQKKKIIEGELVNEWYCGPPGTGKSMKAFTEHPDAYVKNTNKWWDGYDGQEYVIIDDIDPDTARPLTRYLKIWADRYPFQAEYKGGSAMIQGVKLIVTSNFAPEEIWSGEDLRAIKRRFKVTHFDKLM